MALVSVQCIGADPRPGLSPSVPGYGLAGGDPGDGMGDRGGCCWVRCGG